jgi:2-polyprenyl-3-methyl-5-hydroxy-6-metoxy-1,4-benzoquinol methylase
MFDQNRYWITRHERYRDDPRSVGNLGKSLEENRRAEGLMQERVGQAARLLRPCASVLDVGCGYGRVATPFCDAGYDYTGVDVSDVAIETARAREPRGTFVTGSALEVTFERKFDIVCALYVFVHFVSDADWSRLLARLAGMVSDGGGLLFADEFPPRTRRPASHVVQRPLRTYRERLRRLGMRLDPQFRVQLAAALDMPRHDPLPFHLARKPASRP